MMGTGTGRRVARGVVLAAVALMSATALAAPDATHDAGKTPPKATAAHARPRWALEVHGGAGVIERADMDPAREAAYRAALDAALERGAKVLDGGGTALDAIEVVIRGLEDDPLFNAGKGAVFTADGRNELDAAIMDGATLQAGAVAGVTHTRNPISLARAVMDQSPHVMLIGSGADSFGAAHGVEQADPAYFFTEPRWQQLKKALQEKGMPVPPRPAGVPEEPSPEALRHHAGLYMNDHKFGTVGVVALDSHGHIAAGTSTGGTTGKLWGRVGDSPLIGAGTYAADDSCAVSGTGVGEYFIRLTVAREICALVQYRHLPLQAAADEVIQKRLTALGGDGGVIALTADGQLAWSFNSSGMYRARLVAGGTPQVAIYKDEP